MIEEGYSMNSLEVTNLILMKVYQSKKDLSEFIVYYFG